MAYSLQAALGSLDKAPKPYSLYHSSKFTKGELVVGTCGGSDLLAIQNKAGSKLPVATGTVRWSDDLQVLKFKTSRGGTSFKAVMNTLVKVGNATKTAYNDAPAEDINAPQDGDGQGGTGTLPNQPTDQTPLTPTQNNPNQPLPQIPTNQNPLNNPGGNVNQPVNRPVLRRNQQIPVQRNPNPQTFQRVAPRKLPVNPMAPRSVTSAFNSGTMASVKKATDRGLIKGQGKFGKVFTGVENLGKIEAKLRGPNGQLDQPSKTKLVQAYDTMLGNISTYLVDREEDEPKDDVVKVKQGFCKKAETTLRLARAQVKYSDKFDRLNQLSQKATLTDDEADEAEQTKAELLLRMNDEKDDQKPSSGSSDVRLIRNENGEVAYVFKSIDGESSQMNMAKGEGTAHEVLSSKLSDIFGTFGFNTGFPKTSMATLPLSEGGGQRNNKVGALVEGIPGKPPAEVGEMDPNLEILRAAGFTVNIPALTKELRAQHDNEKKVQTELQKLIANALQTVTPEQKKLAAGKMNARLQLIGKQWDENTRIGDMNDDLVNLDSAEANALALQVPPAQMQQALLTGILSSSADVKWSNVMIDGTSARPFDGGGNMMTAEQMKQFQTTKSGKVDPLIGTAMLYLPSKSGLHPGATAPLDPNLKTQVLNIDPRVVEQEMTVAVQKMQQTSPELQNALGNSNVQMSVASLICMQNAMQAAAPNATMEEIVTAFNLNMKAWMEGTDYPNAPAH